MPPLILRGDECLAAYLLDCGENNRRVALRVELIKREDICDMEVECNMKENEQSLVDDYFDREFYFENNICDAASAPAESGVNLGCELVDLLNKRTTSSSPTPNHIDPLNYYDSLDHHDEQNQVPSEDTFSFPDGLDLAIGQEFKNKDEVKTKLNDIAIKACFEMEINKSTKSLYVTKCIDKSCNWAVRAAKVTNSERFSIRTYCNTHTCSLISRKRKHRQSCAAVVANVVRSSFDGQKETPKPKAIMTIMQNNHMPITYWKAWKGKKLANNLLRGSLELSFQNLPAYLYMVRKMNPGTITHLEVDEDSKFKYVFLAYGACIKGFRCMRKVIAVDGTWLKTKYKCVMLIATAEDGNFHQYPIDWAVVDSENDASWSWFLIKLQELIPDDSDLVFISDINQSIINGVSNIYRKSQHGHCRWHLSQNIKARVRVKGVIKLFKETANAYKVSDFNKLYDELKNRYPVAVKFLEESNLTLSKWARSHFTGCRYNIMTTNGAKSINAALREPREYPIIALLEAMQAKVSEWFNNRRNIVASINTKCTPLTPKAENIIRKRFKKASEMTVKQLNRFEYEVTGKENDAIIDLGQRQCSCRVFDLDQLPCVHALASYEQDGIEVYDLCSNYYKLETWALAYVDTIYPVPQQEDWDINEVEVLLKVLPPNVPIKRGRAKLKRIPSVGEGKKWIKRCGLCGQPGHSKKTYSLRATISKL
ncbi:uncharacterized protein LOC133795160 [Humulus lupulus]|uniref:uncharacterized protein LOC133795160 n=1 Tax=Humulus lupulus TaxID=3486 RepID=UPI002B40494C|nr:uncharacterized protein LOC133795160 [Humulus lupulus]